MHQPAPNQAITVAVHALPALHSVSAARERGAIAIGGTGTCRKNGATKQTELPVGATEMTMSAHFDSLRTRRLQLSPVRILAAAAFFAAVSSLRP
jgi:hypothetical protein